MNRRSLILSAPALLAATPGHAQDAFGAFVAGVKAEARRAGIRDATLQAAFAGVQPNPRVIELDRKQPEFTLTWPEYRARVLPDSRIQSAVSHYAEERNLLARVEQRFGVSPGVIMGIWGIESAFGVNKGNYRLVEALSTLAFEGRRAAYFRTELLNALRILDAGDVTPARLTGGWAGAMGQPQFMPSSYLKLRGGFRGARAPRHLGQQARRVRLHRQLPGQERLAPRGALGTAGAGAAGDDRRTRQQA